MMWVERSKVKVTGSISAFFTLIIIIIIIIYEFIRRTMSTRRLNLIRQNDTNDYYAYVNAQCTFDL